VHKRLGRTRLSGFWVVYVILLFYNDPYHDVGINIDLTRREAVLRPRTRQRPLQYPLDGTPQTPPGCDLMHLGNVFVLLAMTRVVKERLA
jgi:hypothetical protein